ncbi:HlyD family secretion protein [Novipirellula aureliae]|uniref:HlyD family secretion protein n=1 Tax=Novipirellula aureliae TaxID=2527966 RepID=A0A5C6DEY5_9BACT|nr:biotin/lipoyl-binding protein [Novipirellula aureliae]TWU35242.1 HlyD family secretion protein [Novipirellula aureliae]
MACVRDQLVIKLNRGSSKSESFQSICQTLAEYANVDRVCLLEKNGKWFYLAATSNGKSIDRRTRLSRSMQAFVTNAVDVETLTSDTPFCYTVGSGEPIPAPISESFHRFLIESGSRQVAIIRFDPAESIEQDSNASLPHSIVILLERFDARDQAKIDQAKIDQAKIDQAKMDQAKADQAKADRVGVCSEINEIQSLVEASLVNAVNRKVAWTEPFFDRIRRASFRKRIAFAAATLVMLFALLLLVPIEFWVPAEGQLVPSIRRSIFAPADGTVLELPVGNGSSVDQGDTIAIIRSRDLDLKTQQIENEIAAVRANLDSLVRSRGSSSDRLDSSASSTEQVLKARLEGLAQQAEFLNRQQQELTVRSPIRGQIDHWNMEQNLSSRPVARGQFLADVVNEEGGWVLQIELDDRHSGYMTPMMPETPFKVNFALRSQPGKNFDAILDQIDDTVQQNESGKWVVRARADLPMDAFSHQSSVRSGATADVKILAGTRSIGFVWFRGLIEWFRTKV